MDISYAIDPETLRDSPNDPDAMRQALSHYRRMASQEERDARSRVKALGTAGTLARMLGELDLAQELLTTAVSVAEANGDHVRAFVNRIRLAHTYHWQEDFVSSTALFEELLQNPVDGYRDFVLQHAGKNEFDKGEYRAALSYFRLALHLRKLKGDPELIESTMMALRATRIRFEGAGG